MLLAKHPWLPKLKKFKKFHGMKFFVYRINKFCISRQVNLGFINARIISCHEMTIVNQEKIVNSKMKAYKNGKYIMRNAYMHQITKEIDKDKRSFKETYLSIVNKLKTISNNQLSDEELHESAKNLIGFYQTIIDYKMKQKKEQEK
jgi:hypothetical protein